MEEGPLRIWVGALPEVDLHDRAQRLSLVPIVRAAIDRDVAPDVRRERYGSLLDRYVLCGPDEAEVALLPRTVSDGADPAIAPLMAEADRRGLRTMIFGVGDLEPIVDTDAAIVLHPGPTRGAQRRADVLASPYVLTDRWTGPLTRPVADRPIVGFCGQGANRPGAGLAQLARRAADAGRNRRRPTVVTPPLRGHVGLRSRALRHLADHRGVDTRFIVRDRYRSGSGAASVLSAAERRRRAEEEFDDNLRESVYVLCVRGTGNFSARFFEALSFGRIPLFVDTRCVLPFEDEIPWREHTVWVDAADVDHVGDRVVDVHRDGVDGSRSAATLRSLWEDRLTQDGFFRHLVPAIRRLL